MPSEKLPINFAVPKFYILWVSSCFDFWNNFRVATLTKIVNNQTNFLIALKNFEEIMDLSQIVPSDKNVSFKDQSIIVLADWLKVRGTLKGWTKLWCILKPGLLLLYRSPKAKVSNFLYLFTRVIRLDHANSVKSFF